MARYRLIKPHYLNVPGTEWEQKETSRENGKQIRKVYEVPLHLDPDNPGDHNYPGEIIVATSASRQYPRDVIFVGQPTPDMEPLDDEAQAQVDALMAKWVHPVDSLPANGDYNTALIQTFEKQMALLSAQLAPKQADDRVANLEAQVQKLTEMLERLGGAVAVAPVEEQVIDDMEPLPPPDVEDTLVRRI